MKLYSVEWSLQPFPATMTTRLSSPRLRPWNYPANNTGRCFPSLFFFNREIGIIYPADEAQSMF